MNLLVFELVKIYFVAFGVVIGGSIFGGIGAFLVKQPPMDTMNNLSNNLKIWALVVALGGTFDSIKVLLNLDGNFSPVVKQVLYIIMGLVGAYTGSVFMQWLIKGDID